MEKIHESDDWVSKALLNDDLVAEMLIRLSQPKDLSLNIVKDPLKWLIRKPRSREFDMLGIEKAKEDDEAIRAALRQIDPVGNNKGKEEHSPQSVLRCSANDGSSVSDAINGGGDGSKKPSGEDCAIAIAGSGSGDRVGASHKRKSKMEIDKIKTKRLKHSTGGRAKKKKLAELKVEVNELQLDNAALTREREKKKIFLRALRKDNLLLIEKLKVKESQLPSTKADIGKSSSPPERDTSTRATTSSSRPEADFLIPDLNLMPEPEEEI